jgi:hypothetical protein
MGDDDQPRWYVGESKLLHALPIGITAFGLLAVGGEWLDDASPIGALVVVAIGVYLARALPWRFEVRNDGLQLWFPFGACRFLPRETVIVRVDPESPVAFTRQRRVGYPLPDGMVGRRSLLRAILAEHGYEVT